ncbi:MAG: hypothetical protein COV47_05150 [Candidatus Diapherotrites archaeon CG11_big_fil_rev_8_21_14_0_20_37_9]|nr:MAG: hypothetical protein COV47_05150 [Candidatus Diapherotrites archaeon CG11_big_fil_rev_8_21_14_0_20_37_9]
MPGKKRKSRAKKKTQKPILVKEKPEKTDEIARAISEEEDNYTGRDVDETRFDADDIREEIEDTGRDVDEIKEDVDDIKEGLEDTGKDVDEIKENIEEISRRQKSILKKVSDRMLPSEFNANDIAQQIVGAIILSSPLAVTEEVWRLAKELDPARTLTIIGVTLLFDVLLIYFTAYRKEKEKKIINLVPARLVSMLVISYSTAAIMLYIFGVIGYEVTTLAWAFNLIIFIGLFANVGAGTADIIR